MRPQSAALPKQHKRILFNQQSGQHYILSDQGNQVRTNQRGELIGKFLNDFSGFFNFKKRKQRSIKDNRLMYTEPKIAYNKQNSPISPKGTKFVGYAQYPYSLKGETPQFLGQITFKQTSQARYQENDFIKLNFSSQLPHYSQIKKKKTLNKFQSIKNLKSQNPSIFNFDLIDQNKSQQKLCKFINSRHNTSQQKQQKSVILKASQKYGSAILHKRIKSTNTSSASSFHRNQHLNQFKETKSIHQLSYFEQSLSNIQKTENPNYFHSNFSYCNFPYKTLNKTSIKPKCYKSSCHQRQYMSKRRYIKQRKQDNTVNIRQCQIQLDAEQKEKQLVKKLKEELQIYQPIIVQSQVKTHSDIKNVQKDKAKQKKKPGAGILREK